MAWAAALLLVASVACSGKEPEGPALAEVHNVRLRGQMRELRALAIADLGDATRAETTRIEIRRIANNLRSVADGLPDLAYSLELDAENRSRWVAFSDGLHASASRLAADAESGPPELLRIRIEELGDTCAGCHWAFRVEEVR